MCVVGFFYLMLITVFNFTFIHVAHFPGVHFVAINELIAEIVNKVFEFLAYFWNSYPRWEVAGNDIWRWERHHGIVVAFNKVLNAFAKVLRSRNQLQSTFLVNRLSA